MNLTNYEMLAELLQEFQQENNALQRQIDEKLIKIQEADCYIQSILNKDDVDFKIFSPRNSEDIYKEEISKTNSNKEEYQKELDQCYDKQNLLLSKIEKLENILKNEEQYYIDSSMKKKNLTILNIQEQDRQRIARDLHDTSLQNLANLVHRIELSSMFIDQDPVRAKLELTVVNQNLRKIIDEIRNTIFNLRPMTFDDLGLKSAFQNLTDNINIDKKYIMELEIEDVSCEDDLVLTAIYRIVQECLNNIDKHAEADKITFYAKNKDNFYIIDIKDNGKGFSESDIEKKQNRHFGMTVMNERVDLLGGKISISSDKGKGTHIHIEIPLT